jgi:GT2 family glycosyltransferase
MAIPAAEFEQAGGFAERFFLYHEDVDLSLRLRLAGGRLGVESDARVDHDYEFAKGPDKWRRLERNRWATLVRTYPGALLALIAPALVATELALVPISVRGGWGAQKLASWLDVLRWLPRLRRERLAIQRRRRIEAGAFARALTPELDSAYLGAAGRSRGLRVLLRAYWSVVLALLPG